MKKLYLPIILGLIANSAQAQMMDTIGALGIQGELGAEAYRGIGQMQNALGRVNFQQDLSTLLLYVQTNFMNGYRGLSKETLAFDGFEGIDWNIGSETPSSFYIEFNNLDAASCMSCKNPSWGYKHIDINNGGDCTGSDHIKMYF